MLTSDMNIARIWVIATNVFREVLRERVIYIAGVFTIIFVLCVLFLNDVAAGTEQKITLDVGLAGIGWLGLVVAAFEGGSLIRKELEKRTALVLLAKPISRAEFIVGKHLGLSAVLGVLVALMGVIFLTIINWRQIDYAFSSMVLALGYTILQLSLMSAVAVLCGVFSSSLMATIITVVVYIMGHFSHNLLAFSNQIPTESVKNIAKGIYLIFPDLSRLDLKVQAVSGVLPDGSILLNNLGYGLVYIVLLLTVSTLMFSYREF